LAQAETDAMTKLVYLEPTTATEAVALLAEYGSSAKVLAGGTAVNLLMQQKLIQPAALISLEHVDGMRGITIDTQGTLHICAMTSLKQVAADGQIRQGWPVLADACATVGNVRLRNQATLGGNIAEADYASDPPAALIALDASVRVLGPRGERRIDLGGFFLGFYTTALAEDEVLMEILVQPFPSKTSSLYVKYKSRSAIDRPCVGVAAVLAVDEVLCTQARIAVGAACEVPQRFRDLERELIGQRLTPAIVASFAESYATALVSPLDDLRGSASYRREMTRVHIKRALSLLAGLENAT
jgi:carbon-monoxide dehydrogenase medium subunit